MTPSWSGSPLPVRKRLFKLLTVGLVAAYLLGQSSFQIQWNTSHVQRGVSAKQPHNNIRGPVGAGDSAPDETEWHPFTQATIYHSFS